MSVSPIDGRYKNEEVRKYLDENILLKYCMYVERAVFQAHTKRIGIKHKIEFEFPTIMEVLEEEQKTHHQIKAIVEAIKNKVPREYRHLVHLGVTSSDIYDTANSLMIKNAMTELMFPKMVYIHFKLRAMINKYDNIIQIGRTHGQHAIPMKFIHTLDGYRSRLEKSGVEINTLVNRLGGKISGAVGNYAGLSLITDAKKFEKDVLDNLGIDKVDCYSQIMEPEYIARLLLELNLYFGIIANMADDFRHLQRSEIDEVRETFEDGQVGSSTMPHKRNPWNSEHIKSMWKALSPRVMTFYMDQISEHQRDLTSSASGRFINEYIAGFAEALDRMVKILNGLQINKDKMLENIDNALWIAEPVYILMADQGISNAHEICMDIASKSKNNNEFLKNFRNEWKEIWDKIAFFIPTMNQYAGVN